MSEPNWTWCVLGEQWECLHRGWKCSVGYCKNTWQFHAVRQSTVDVLRVTGTAAISVTAQREVIAAVDSLENARASAEAAAFAAVDRMVGNE